MNDSTSPRPSILLEPIEDGRTRIPCRFEDQTIWRTQALVADLFQTTPQDVIVRPWAIPDEGGARSREF